MCSIAKDAEQKHSAQELLKSRKDIEQLIIDNQYYKEQIKEIHNQKRIDDEQAQLENSRIINELGKFLVKIFFGKFWKIYIVFFWIILYAIFYFYCNDAIEFINQIGLFLIVFILGKFLKDGLGIFFNVAGKK
ncbi:MAG: hypothetical protein HDT11_01870 [Helicobacter sp.]|nr:hypothetical protein [Helicobacter sp.]